MIVERRLKKIKKIKNWAQIAHSTTAFLTPTCEGEVTILLHDLLNNVLIFFF